MCALPLPTASPTTTPDLDGFPVGGDGASAEPSGPSSFPRFVAEYRDRLAHLFGERHDLDQTGAHGGCRRS